MPDDQVRIDVQVTGQTTVDRLKESITGLEKQVEVLDQEFAAGKGTAAEYAAQMGKLNGEIAQQTQLMNRSAGNLGSMRQGITAATYAFQDFTSASGGLSQKLNAISNNIPGILAMFGTGGPWTLALTAAATAIIPIIGNWDKLMELITGEKTEKAKDQMEELAKAAQKLHEEMEKLKVAPTEAEKGVVEDVTRFLRRRPMAARAIEAVARGMPEAQARRELPEDIAAQVRPLEERLVEERQQAIQAGRDPDAETRGTRLEIQRLMLQGRQRVAEQVVQQAQQAGPAGERARQRLVAATRGLPGMGYLEIATDEELRRRGARQAHETNLAMKRASDQAKIDREDVAEGERMIEQQRGQAFDERGRKAEQARHKAGRDAEAARRQREQFDEESRRRFARIPDIDVMAAQYAALPARERPGAQRWLRDVGREALLEQEPTMPREELARRAAQLPGYLLERERGREAQAAAAAAVRGVTVEQMAEAQGLSGQQVAAQMAANQATYEQMQRYLAEQRHQVQQMNQNARNMGKLDSQTKPFFDSGGNGL